MRTSMRANAPWWVVVLSLVVVYATAGETQRGGEEGVLHRFKRQIGFNFGSPNFSFARPPPANNAGRQDPGRPVDVGHVLGSVIGGFLNPQSQNANNNLAGALAGLNNALSPNQLPGDCNQDKGGCEHGCRQQGRFVRCFCNSGFVLNRDRKTCSDIDECQFSNAGCRQVCNNTPGSFGCACRPGFTLAGDGRSCQPGGGGGGFPGGGGGFPGGGGGFPGGGGIFPGGGGGGVAFPGAGGGGGIFPGGGGVFPGAQTGGNIGRGCAVNNGGCEQTCVDKENGQTACRCEAGYGRDDADKTKCVDVNECERNNAGCSDVCTNTVGSFTCSCTGDRVLNRNGKKCRDVSASSPATGAESCDENNGGCEQICRERNGRVRCRCEPGYTRNQDLRTCTDIDECSFNNGGCPERCTNTAGSFECGCESPGATLQADGRTCSGAAQPVVESCIMNNGGCSQGCRLIEGRVLCSCVAGYELAQDLKFCSDIDECSRDRSVCPQRCVNSEGSFRCECLPGYSLTAAGNDCVDSNECSINNGGCSEICYNLVGSFRCLCRPGRELGPDGVCRNPPTNTMTSTTSPTTSPTTPTNPTRTPTQGAFTIGATTNPMTFTSSPFPFSTTLRTTTTAKPIIFPAVCWIINGGCQQVCQQTFQGARCFCNQGYNLLPDGRTCSDLNECDFRNGGCSDTCTNTPGSFTCSCTAGRILQQDGRTCGPGGGGCNVNNGGCEHTCNPSTPPFFGSTPCGCNPGYTLNSDGRTCNDIDECQLNNGNCPQICKNEPGSFLCQCRPGFTLVGTTCQATAINVQPPTSPALPGPSPSQPSTQLRSCGQNTKKNINNQIRIVGGTPANPNDWPWMAALLQSSNNNQYCGGALVTDRHVLTAAHCVVQFKSSDIKVRVGEYDFQESSDNSPLDFNVADIEAHEQYDTKTQENDIAVLKLDRAVAFSEFVHPVCLPPPGTDVEGLSAFVIGWGTTAFGGPVSNVLREVQVPIWTRNDCDASYPDKVFERMMCAGLKKGGKDSCQGDSGGPLLTQLPGSRTWYVAGVVSWGIECARADRPGVYTNVEDYLSWIESKLQ